MGRKVLQDTCDTNTVYLRYNHIKQSNLDLIICNNTTYYDLLIMLSRTEACVNVGLG